MTWTDPIVEEVRATRERLLQEAGGFEAYIKKLRAQELKHSQRLFSKKDIHTEKPTTSRDN